MELTKLFYRLESDAGRTTWVLDTIFFQQINLLVGKNATGKSRISNVIFNLASIIAEANLENEISFEEEGFESNWELLFSDLENKIQYMFSLGYQTVLNEVIFNKEDLVLSREEDETVIYSAIQNKQIGISPPDDKLVLHIRRDKNEFPYFETLIDWAKNFKIFEFGTFNASDSEDLENYPTSLYEKLGRNAKKNVVLNMNQIGYSILDITLQKNVFGHQTLFITEKGLNPLPHTDLSQGMFRALSLLIFIEFVLEKNKKITILIDDLGEGLDYERATKLGKLLVEKLENSNIQFIATSNDSFLMDVVPIKYWNILQRDGNTVKSLNYQNSKERFDKFLMTGLSNFDLFSSDYLMRPKP